MSERHNVQPEPQKIQGDQITSNVTDCQPVTHGQSNTVGRRTHTHTPPSPALAFVLLVAPRASDRRTIMGNVTQSKRRGRSDILTPLSFSTELSVLDRRTHTYKAYFDCFMTGRYSQHLILQKVSFYITEILI